MAGTRTRRRICQQLREGPLQAQEVGEALDIDKSAAYRQLERLRENGLVAAERLVDGPGRPKKIYRLTEEGHETFPRNYDVLLGKVLAGVEDRRGRDELLALLGDVAEEMGAPIAELEGHRERVEALVELYDDLGFEARLEEAAGDLVLVQRNCPFRQIAREDPDALCEGLDEEIQRIALPGAEVDLDCSMAKGDRQCRHAIREAD